MNRKFCTVAIGLAIAAFSGLANAQFSLPSVPGMGGGSAKTSSVSAESLVKNYVVGTKLVMNSNAKFFAALGLKDKAAEQELQANKLTEGATSSGLEDAAKVQTESSKALADEMNSKQVVFTAEGKKTYALGVLDLVSGIKSYIGMASDVKSFKPSVTSLGASAGAAIYVAKSLPNDITNLKDTLARSIAFAKANKIELPADATSALPG